jgi:hypothetical protein
MSPKPGSDIPIDYLGQTAITNVIYQLKYAYLSMDTTGRRLVHDHFQFVLPEDVRGD